MLTIENKQTRRSHLTASDAAALFGAHPWRDLHSVWFDKISEPAEDEPNEAMELGTHFEGAVLSLYETRRRKLGQDVTVRPNVAQQLRICERHPILGCTIDAEQTVDGAEGLVEGKTSSGRSYKSSAGELVDPEEEWETGVPLHYQVQAQAQLLVTGAAFVTVPCFLFSSRKLIWHDVFPHEGFQRRLVEKAEQFWAEHVVTCIPPMPVDFAKAVKLLPQRTPERSGRVVLSDGGAAEIDERLRTLKSQRSGHEKAARELEEPIKQYEYLLLQRIGSAAEATIESSGVIWKASNVHVKAHSRAASSYVRLTPQLPKGTE